MTRNKYVNIYKQVKSKSTSLYDILKEFDINEKFCIGCNSSYIFMGTIIDLMRDIRVLDLYYNTKYNNENSILDEVIKKVYVKSMYEPKPMIAFIIEGNRPGKVWFLNEYPDYIHEIRRLARRIDDGV